MPSEALKATAITNLDGSPFITRATAGEGGQGHLQSNYASITPTTGKTTGSTYRMLRVPSNAVVKHLYVDTKATFTTFTVDITPYYSDGPTDEVGVSQGLTGAATSNDTTAALFAHNYDVASLTAGTVIDLVNQAGNYPPGNRNQELWQACGLSADPGGFLDIVVISRSTNSVSGAVLGVEVQFVCQPNA